jgi:hypothetical protein
MAAGPKVRSIAWPALFEPKYLLCPPKIAGQGNVVALTPRGVGAMVPVADSDDEAKAEHFSLDGLAEFGKLAGAAWAKDGLKLITAAGHLLDCEGHSHTDGRWPCRAAEHAPLPLPKGGELTSAAFAEQGAHGPMVALMLKSLPGVAALYRSESGVWHPQGEVHVSEPAGAGLTFDGDDLLVTLRDGTVHRRPTMHGSAGLHAAPAANTAREFCSACAAAEGKLLRLALNKGKSVAKPELITLP